MPRVPGSARIDRLGERLRNEEPARIETLRELQELRATYDEPLSQVERTLRETLRLQPSRRIKTMNTIMEKLRREKTRLSRMQDIAGARVVQEMGLAEQDGLVSRIVGQFSSSRIVDRRMTPSHGYRAVHVVVDVGGLPVEVQVRTHLQQLWAQASRCSPTALDAR